MIKFNKIALLLAIASTSAFAAQGVYISGGVGFADANNMPSEENYGYYQTDLTERQTAFRFAIGYAKDLKPAFGLGAELGYNNYGSDEYKAVSGGYSSDSLEYKYTAVDLLGKATWHVSKTWDLYGKLGIADESVDVNDDVGDNSEVLPEIGLGTSYFATDKLSLDLSVYQTFGDEIEFDPDNDNNAPSITTGMFSVSYYFS